MDSHSDMYAPRFPVHRNTSLKWDYKINIVGTNDPKTKIHNCEKCNFPILSYGRMIPCKHVFCFDCAKATDKTCLRCEDPVQRIEQSPLGNIFLCAYGAPKHSHEGCRRTYLSQRDLLAHINHRHEKIGSSVPQAPSSSGVKDQGHSVMSRMPDPRPDPRAEPRSDHRTHQSYVSSHQDGYPVPPQPQTSHIMPDQRQYEPRQSEAPASQPAPEDYRVSVPVRKSNLITVPLHDSSKDYQQTPKPHATVMPYQPQPPMVGVQQHQAPPPPPPPQQHVPYSQHLPPVSVSHIPPISHPPPVSVSYSVPVAPISGHQVLHSMHPPPAPVHSQPTMVPPPPMNAPHYDNAPRPPFPASNPIPAQNPPFPSSNVPMPRTSWSVGPPPSTNMPPPPQSNMPPPPQTSMPPPPPPSQVPPMGNPVPSMPPPRAPGPRPEMGPPPPPMGPPMTEAPHYHGQYFNH